MRCVRLDTFGGGWPAKRMGPGISRTAVNNCVSRMGLGRTVEAFAMSIKGRTISNLRWPLKGLFINEDVGKVTITDVSIAKLPTVLNLLGIKISLKADGIDPQQIGPIDEAIVIILERLNNVFGRHLFFAREAKTVPGPKGTEYTVIAIRKPL